MRLDGEQARERFRRARVARMCTVGDDGPHPVPVTFACERDVLVTAVDHKPKTTRELHRLRDIEVNPAVALLVDDYREDWSRLWWARAEGHATVLRDAADMTHWLDLLVSRYPQYEGHRPAGPVIRVDIMRWLGWSAGPLPQPMV